MQETEFVLWFLVFNFVFNVLSIVHKMDVHPAVTSASNDFTIMIIISAQDAHLYKLPLRNR